MKDALIDPESPASVRGQLVGLQTSQIVCRAGLEARASRGEWVVGAQAELGIWGSDLFLTLAPSGMAAIARTARLAPATRLP